MKIDDNTLLAILAVLATILITVFMIEKYERAKFYVEGNYEQVVEEGYIVWKKNTPK
jgi:hypothetical protein